MYLPFTLPYIEVIYFLGAAGLVAVVAGSAGALLRAWSWKVPRMMAYAFLGVIAVFVLVSWLFDTMAT